MSKRKAAFLDRDGTLIDDVGYLSNINQISLIPGAIKMCKNLINRGYELFLVTNQSGIARGYFDELFVRETNEKLRVILADAGVDIKACYYCPHHPDYGTIDYKIRCNCRKPRPGMLIQAANDFNIDLESSLMIGDKEADLLAGKAAGCKSFLIKEALEGKILEMLDEQFPGKV